MTDWSCSYNSRMPCHPGTHICGRSSRTLGCPQGASSTQRPQRPAGETPPTIVTSLRSSHRDPESEPRMSRAPAALPAWVSAEPGGVPAAPAPAPVAPRLTQVESPAPPPMGPRLAEVQPKSARRGAGNVSTCVHRPPRATGSATQAAGPRPPPPQSPLPPPSPLRVTRRPAQVPPLGARR